MKLLSLCLGVISGISLILPPSVKAADTASDNPAIIITEVKIKNDTSGYNEYIELYNAGTISLNLNEFTIEYFNTPAPNESDLPVKKSLIANGLLMPNENVVLAGNPEQMPNTISSPFSSLSDSGGLLRIRGIDNEVHDQFAWTSSSTLAIPPVELLLTSSTNRNKSFIRSSDEKGNFILINPSWQLLEPSPQANILLPVPEPDSEPEGESATTIPEPEPSIETSNVDNTVLLSAGVAPIQISELLPNPAPPASDSTDEFVELYNPNSEAIDLKDYRLQTGNSYSYDHTFPDITLNPNEFRAFKVIETGALLANSGGRARLLDPSGQIIFETVAYDKADEGFAWAFINGGWQWTTTPTPDAANVLTLPTSSSKTAASKTAKAKTVAKPKATSTKAKSSAKPKVSKATGAAKDDSSNESNEPGGVHSWIIAGVGIIAVAYAAYEYRHDLANRIYQLRRYRTARVTSRAKP